MQEMSKPKKTLLLITLFSSGVILMSEMILTPTINLLYTLYPNSVGLINFAITGCYIFSTLASLVIGKLCEKFSKKSLLIIGALLGTIGGVGMFLTIEPILLTVWRSLLMISYAFTMTVAISFINDLYSNEIERGKVIGYFNGFTTGFGAILSYAAGVLATASIRAAYSLHFLIVLYLIMLFIFVPSIKPEAPKQEDIKEEVKQPKVKAKMGATYWITIINYSFYTLAFCTAMYFSSVYVAENSLGNEAMAGAISSTITIVGFLTSIAFGKIYEKTGNSISPISYALSVVGVLLMWIRPAVWTAYLGFGILGGACCFLKVFHYAFCPSLVSEKLSASAIAFIEAGTMIAVLITTYFVTFIMRIANMATFTQFLPITFGIMIVNTIVGTIVLAKHKKESNQSIK